MPGVNYQRISPTHYSIPILKNFVLLAVAYVSGTGLLDLAYERSKAERFAKNMEFFVGGAEGGFLPKKEPSAILPQEICHVFRQLL